MELSELKRFIVDEDKHLREKYDRYQNDKTYPFVSLAKLVEEVGELSEEILKREGTVRKEKLQKPSDLEGEVADVIITAMLLAHALDVDVEAALKEKIERIRTRRASKKA